MKPSGPPILPMYKVSNGNKRKSGGIYGVIVAILLPVLAVGLLAFFFLSIYLGTYYLQDHLQDESPNGILNNLGIPNTRNVIQKWSIANLHGVDLTKLGPPPRAIAQGMAPERSPYPLTSVGNWTGSISPASLKELPSRLTDSLSRLYHKGTSAGAAKLRGYLALGSVPQLNSSALTHGLAQGLSLSLGGKTGAALKSVAELGRAGAREVAALGQRGAQGLRGAAGLLRAGGAAVGDSGSSGGGEGFEGSEGERGVDPPSWLQGRAARVRKEESRN